MAERQSQSLEQNAAARAGRAADEIGTTDDLDAVCQRAWALIVRGAADRRSPLHTPAVATVGPDGAPEIRTVVLRGADPSAWTLRFHTDQRSAKVLSLAREPRIALLAYDPGGKVQLRFGGRAVVHADDARADAAWAASQTMSRVCYTQVEPPGARFGPVYSRASMAPPSTGAGRENFAAVVLHVTRLDWLHLAASGHRRALFERDGAGSGLTCAWLAP